MIPNLLDLSVDAVVKHGVGGRETVPIEVQGIIRAKENQILLNLTGKKYRQYYNKLIVKFDIGWKLGTWRFDLYLPGRCTGSALRVEIRAWKDTQLSPEWAELFGLSDSVAGHKGFTVADFHIDIKERKVTFHGRRETGSFWKQEFKTEFWFSKTTFFVRIRCDVFDSSVGGFRTLTEECFEQNDTPGFFFMTRDSELHPPRGFHYPLLLKYQ